MTHTRNGEPMTTAQRPARPGGAWRAALLAAALLGAAAACSDLLQVDTTDRIAAQEFERNPANARTLVNGAVADFECAYGAYAALGALVGDELIDATQTADRFPYDLRSMTSADRRYAVNDCDALGAYTPLNRARTSADNVLRRLQGWTDAEVPQRQNLMAKSANIAGYALIMLGEGFCSGVISQLDDSGNPVYGAEQTPAQMLAAAVDRFNTAIAAATTAGDQTMLRLALLGRARARLDLGQYAEARLDAAQIPAGFQYLTTASGSSSKRNNQIWAQNSGNNNATSVGPLYRGLADPRVPVDSLTDASGNIKKSVLGVPLWRQNKYASVSSPMVLASYQEARLIIAESAARTGDLATALTIINEERARGNQPALAGPLTQAEALAQIIEQRRREFFLDGHHLGDYIRFSLPFNPPPGTAYHAGGVYGSNRCLPLPDVEKNNNPNF